MTKSSKLFTERFGVALAFAEEKHRSQFRKGSEIPYISHLLSVSALVIENGGNEDEAIGGLLHDVVEDQAGEDPHPLMNEISSRFGENVLAIVLGCSDSYSSENKPPWKERKENYIAHIADASPSVLLVSCADKTHNARAILADLRAEGDAVWNRFSAPCDQVLWYYESLSDAFSARTPIIRPNLVNMLTRTIDEIKLLARLPSNE